MFYDDSVNNQAQKAARGLFFCAFFAVTRKKVRKQVRDAEGKKLNFGGN